MKKFLLTLVTACVGLLGSQAYANYPCCGDPCAQPCCPPPCFDSCCGCDVGGFQGFYVGGHIGWAFHDLSWTDRDGWTDEFGTDFHTGTIYRRTDGVEVGARVGYDWQCGCNTLWGILADFSWTDVNRRHSHDLDDEDTTLTIHDRSHWFGTIRARAGITADNLLLYASAGAAWLVVDHRWGIRSDESEYFNDDRSRWGLAVGLGLEWLWCGGFSFFAEAVHLRFPERTRSFTSAVAERRVRFDLVDSIWCARVGINYRICDLGGFFF